MFVGAAVGWGCSWGWRGGSIDIDRNLTSYDPDDAWSEVATPEGEALVQLE